MSTFPLGILTRNLVESMSTNLFGMPYSELQKIIYPSPRYKSFIINKRNGSPRVIHEPRAKLKALQDKVLLFLEENAAPAKPCVHGFTVGKSIVTNAKKHCSPQTKFVLNVDLKDYFPSINFYRVRGIFMKKPFSCSHAVATVLAQICTHNNELPQGAPTSPFLANLASRRLDTELMDLAKRHRATYTRYADDLTFSFSVRKASSLPENICSYDSGVLTLGKELISTIEHNSFDINPSKSRISTPLHRMEVTGITINEFPNVKRNFVDRVRGTLHAWEKYGLAATQEEWEKKMEAAKTLPYEKKPWHRQRRCKGFPSFYKILWGKLLYVRMVRGASDALYTRFAERFNELCRRDMGDAVTLLPIENIVRNAVDVERAVFVVNWMGDYQVAGAESEACASQGTAFAYLSANQLITCEHVLRCELEVNGRMLMADFQSDDMRNGVITVHSPTLGFEVPVRVVRRDRDRDLAVLEFVELPPAGIRHFAGRDSLIKRNEHGILVGYPNWNHGRVANQAAANVLNRFPRRGLQRIEISANIRKGNSGGPYVDELFRVAGVAQEGATQADGNDECLCVDELDKWLAS